MSFFVIDSFKQIKSIDLFRFILFYFKTTVEFIEKQINVKDWVHWMKAGGLPLHDQTNADIFTAIVNADEPFVSRKIVEANGKVQFNECNEWIDIRITDLFTIVLMWGALLSSFIAFILAVIVVVIIMAFIFGLFAEMFYG